MTNPGQWKRARKHSAGTVRVAIPANHAAQARVEAEALRFNVLCCGRRWGKTMFGVRRAVRRVLAGEPVGWFAPSYKYITDVWRDLARRLDPVTVKINSSDRRIEVVTGGVLDMWSLSDNPNPGRGRAYKEVIVDEAAFIPNLEEAWTKAIRPTLTDLRGDGWFFSTPKGLNYFHALRRMGDSSGEWAGWDMPTATNPYIDPEEIEAARLSLPERVFAQEYLAQFIDDGGGVFRGVTACVDTEPYPFKADPGDGRAFVIGVDWGRVEDWTVITVMDAKEKRVAALDRFNRIDYQFQIARLKALAERFPRAPIVAESNAMGDPIISQLRRDGHWVYGFQTTNATKAQIVEALAIAFETQKIRIPPDKALIGELLAYDHERLPSGMVRYSAPPGQHDDCVISLALAWHGASLANDAGKTFRIPTL